MQNALMNLVDQYTLAQQHSTTGPPTPRASQTPSVSSTIGSPELTFLTVGNLSHDSTSSPGDTSMPTESPTTMPPKMNHLSEVDKQAITIMIANAFTQIHQDNPMQGVVSPGTTSGTVTTVPDTLKAEEVGLFNPDVDDPTELNARIVTVRCHMVHKDVFAFTNCLTHLAKVRSEEKLQEIFPTLL